MKREITNVLPLERFIYHAGDGSLSAFESDLRDRKFDGTYPWMEPLYHDASDMGICLRREKDGKEVRFYLAHVEARDGDLKYWFFFPEDSTKTGIRSVTIYND